MGNETQFNSAAEAVAAALGVLAAHKFAKGRFPVKAKENVARWRQLLPYSIQDAGVPGKKILLNRDYKPVGYTGDPSIRVDYAKYPECHVDLSDEQVATVARVPSRDAMFDDGSKPWSSREAFDTYAERLKRLRDLIN